MKYNPMNRNEISKANVALAKTKLYKDALDMCLYVVI